MKRNRKQVAIPESNLQHMSRRSSSLVTVNLDDETTDEEIERPNGTTPVIQIGEEHGLSSTDRIFQIVVADRIQNDTPTFPENVPSGVWRKMISWFETCNCKRNGSGCCNQISKYFSNKLQHANKKLQEKCGNSYLETYFLYASGCGVSPFCFDKDKQQVSWLKKVPYYIVNTLASVDLAINSKRFIIDMIGAQERKSAEIQLYLKNSLQGAYILLRVGFFVSMYYFPEKYTKVVSTSSASSYAKHLYTKKVFLQSILICCLSFCVVLIKTHIGLLNGIEDHLIGNANDIRSLFCLRKSCLEIDQEELDSTTVAQGILGWIIKFAGNLFLQIARDGILFSALTLGKSADAFQFRRRVKTLTSTNVSAIGTVILNDYKWIKKISKHINSAFNIVFRFFLLANILMFAVFIDEWFNPHMGKLLKGVKLANIVFVCITFYYANQTAKTGDRFREWMKKEKNRKILGLTQMDVMMENSSSSSIGFGRGALFIYDSTLIGIAGVVVAYFLGIVETRPQYEEYCNCTNSSTFR